MNQSYEIYVMGLQSNVFSVDSGNDRGQNTLLMNEERNSSLFPPSILFFDGPNQSD